MAGNGGEATLLIAGDTNLQFREEPAGAFRHVRTLLAAAGGGAKTGAYPPAAMLRSLAVLDGAGIAHCGGGRTEAEARRPVVIVRKDVRFAFLSYTSVFWPVGHAAGPD